SVSTASDLYPLSLHDALPISRLKLIGPPPPEPVSPVVPLLVLLVVSPVPFEPPLPVVVLPLEEPFEPFEPLLPELAMFVRPSPRSEEHTSELQSRENLVCRLL